MPRLQNDPAARCDRLGRILASVMRAGSDRLGRIGNRLLPD
ncbi:MAG: hypothetical protein ACOY45_15000 [Pseudomonadota bacterium]